MIEEITAGKINATNNLFFKPVRNKKMVLLMNDLIIFFQGLIKLESKQSKEIKSAITRCIQTEVVLLTTLNS